ncbi:MAG: hypothetical protein ACE5EM_04075 [Sphingomonadales bacterium]
MNMTITKRKSPSKERGPGELDTARFAQYPIFANLGALIVCLSLLPGLLRAGDVVPLDRLALAMTLFGVGLLAALWAGYSGKIFRLAKGNKWAALNFVVPVVLSSILLFIGAFFGIALLWAALP